MSLKIESGIVPRAIATVLYGVEAIGKTTLASMFPRPVFADTEHGTARLDVRRVTINKWEELFEMIDQIIADPSICETFVLDTADWAEALCIKYILDKNHKASIEDFGYGKGYTYIGEEFSRLLAALDKLIEAGINVTVVAHAKPRKYELPEEEGQFDRYEMKLSKQVAPLLKEWCDMLLFCNYKTYVVTNDDGKKKAMGGKRVMYTNHRPTFDAKNRFGLPDELDLDYKSISHLFNKVNQAEPKVEKVETKESPTQLKLKKLMEESGVTAEQLEYLVVTRKQYPNGTHISDYKDEFITRWVFPNWAKIVEAIKSIGGK